MELSQCVEAVRGFNRFYTRQIGVLQEKLLRSPFSLAEARVIYELAHSERTTATELSNQLGLDAGYLSRILRNFKKQELIERLPSATDGRQNLLWLTPLGQATFGRLNAASHDEIGAMLAHLPGEGQHRLVEAMRTIEQLLGDQQEERTEAQRASYTLHPPRPGDMGWVIQRHAALYAQEYGWGETFEALVVEIVAKFVQQHDPARERCWIAEHNGENVGSVFLVRQSDEVAKLRLLLVEPTARGLGIGTGLVNECIHFARRAGYQQITLWTNDVLKAARHIYSQTGFRLVYEEPNDSFGEGLIGETWELTL